MKLYEAIAQNARLLSTPYWGEAAEKRQSRIVSLLPHGSGFDAGTKLESASETRIVFSTSFHHMDENGCYDGWTEHKVTVSASLMHGFKLSISGRNRNDIKDYIGEVFSALLTADFDWLEI